MRDDHSLTDPGLRATIDLLYGPGPTRSGEIRGRTVRGRARYSTDEAVREATRHLLPRLQADMREFARRRPNCGYAHAATDPSCRDPVCQSWIDEVIVWHAERFGPRHADLGLNAILWMSTGRGLRLDIPDGRWRDVLAPAAIAMDAVVTGAWVSAEISFHETATKSDAHELIERLWPEIDRLRALARTGAKRSAPSNGRVGRLDRPARATYWRLRKFQGLNHEAILAEWESLTNQWAASGPEAQVGPNRLEYPAWCEWRRRGALAGVERLEEIGTVQRALAKLGRLTT